MKRAIGLALVGLWACAALASGARQEKFIQIHVGKHWIWYARQDQYEAHKADIEAMYDYADEAFQTLVDDWGMRPKLDHYTLLVNDQTGGGFATGDVGQAHQITGQESPGIGCSYDAFYNSAHGIKAFWAHVLITHEMVNLFTGQIVSGGWPRDWWADDKSPFPLTTAVQIEMKLVPQIAIHHLEDSEGDPLVPMFMELHEQYGWSMFRRAFSMAISDGINWDRFGGNPSALRTNYVAAYLEMGAKEDLSPILGPHVPNYDHTVVAQIIRAHATWQIHARGSAEYASDARAFLDGHYDQVK